MGRRLSICYLDQIYAIFPLFVNNWVLENLFINKKQELAVDM